MPPSRERRQSRRARAAVGHDISIAQVASLAATLPAEEDDAIVAERHKRAAKRLDDTLPARKRLRVAAHAGSLGPHERVNDPSGARAILRRPGKGLAPFTMCTLPASATTTTKSPEPASACRDHDGNTVPANAVHRGKGDAADEYTGTPTLGVGDEAVHPDNQRDHASEEDVGASSDVQEDPDDEEHGDADVAPQALAAGLDDDGWAEVHEQDRGEGSPPGAVLAVSDRDLWRMPNSPCAPHATQYVDVGTLQRRMAAVLTWEKLLGYIAICGRAPFSAEQYMIMMGAVANKSGSKNMHEYKTLRRQMRNNLVGWCFPRSTLLHVEKLERPRGVSSVKMVITENAGRKPAQESVRVVLPSDWAKLDVATYTFYSDVYEHPGRDAPQTMSIERSPMVQRRAPFIGRSDHLWVSFEGVPCTTQKGDIISVPCAARPAQVEQSRTVREYWFQEMATPNCHVRAVYCGTWMIGAVPPLGQNSTDASPPPKGSRKWSAHERSLQQRLSRPSPNTAALENVLEKDQATANADRTAHNGGRRRQARLSYSKNVLCLNPGDQCFLLRAETVARAMEEDKDEWDEPQVTQHCVLIGSLIRSSIGLSAERLVWVDVEDRDDGQHVIRYVGSANAIDMPQWINGPNGTPHAGYEFGHPRDTGYMSDGSRYVVYRFALYMDGFQQTSSIRDTRQVAGCYLMPLGLSLEARRGTGAPHVLTLSPAGVCHNKVVNLFIDDIALGVTKGVDGIDPYGRRVRIFLDPVSFYGDYPAAAAGADVMGHTANAFCTHCSIMKRRSPSGSKIVGMWTNHSRRAGFVRTDCRMAAIRASPLKKITYRVLGMKCTEQEAADRLPLVRLSNLCRSAKPVLNEHDEEVVPSMFESSLSCAAVPDHLFNGLIKNMLNVCFAALPNDEERTKVEKQISSAARENGLPVTGRILKWGSNEDFQGLHNHTMTAFMCILLCSATAFDQYAVTTSEVVFGLARKLQQFVACTYFWPNPTCDGERHNDLFTVEGRMSYYADLQELAKGYLKSCDDVMRHDEAAGAVLDKPNAHRALELAMHTVPAFAHARNCSEMVLELMHQVFKRWLERNTYQDSHLTAVERALARDWMGRLFALYSIWENGDSQDRACSEIGVRRLVLGEEGMILHERFHGVTGFKERFVTSLKSALQQPNLEMMGKCGHISHPRARSVRWHVCAKNIVRRSPNCAVAIAGLKKLATFYKLRSGWEEKDILQYESTTLRVLDKFEGRCGRSSTMRCGLVVQSALCAKSQARRPSWRVGDKCNGVLRLFAVFAIVQVARDGEIWVLGKEMRRVEESLRREFALGDSQKVFAVQMGAGVRRCGAMHICDEGCRAQRRGMDVVHSAGICEGGRYDLWLREDGYPPHMG